MTVLTVVVDHAVRVVAAGDAWALATIMFVENLFPPIPSEAVLPLAGFAVDRGAMSLIVALGAATLGSVAGAWVLYGAGRLGARPVAYRYHRLIRLRTTDLDRADAWFDRHGHALVFWGRMVPLMRSAVSVPAGMSEMPIGRFTLLTTVGSLLWNAVLIVAGLTLGRNWALVGETVERATTGSAVAGTALVAFVIGRRLYRRARRRRP